MEFVHFRVSERQIYVFKVDNLNTPLNTVGLDVSPAILMPYYDEDSSTLFLTGRVSFIFTIISCVTFIIVFYFMEYNF